MPYTGTPRTSPPTARARDTLHTTPCTRARAHTRAQTPRRRARIDGARAPRVRRVPIGGAIRVLLPMASADARPGPRTRLALGAKHSRSAGRSDGKAAATRKQRGRTLDKPTLDRRTSSGGARQARFPARTRVEAPPPAPAPPPPAPRRLRPHAPPRRACPIVWAWRGGGASAAGGIRSPESALAPAHRGCACIRGTCQGDVYAYIMMQAGSDAPAAPQPPGPGSWALPMTRKGRTRGALGLVSWAG
jgi:hypothetical protein